RGDHHLDRHEQIASGTVPSAHALAAGPEHPSGRCARGHPQRHVTVQSGYAQVHAAYRLGERDRDGDRQVVARTAEQVVRADPDVDVQVTRGTAPHAGLAATGQPDPLSVLHPGRDTDVEDRKSTRLNSSHVKISYAVCCWKT